MQNYKLTLKDINPKLAKATKEIKDQGLENDRMWTEHIISEHLDGDGEYDFYMNTRLVKNAKTGEPVWIDRRTGKEV